MKRFALFVAVAGLSGLGVACAGVADLDVKYNPDAGVTTTNPSSSSSGDNGTADASRPPDAAPVYVTPPTTPAPTVTVINECGSCDTQAGLGCCLSGGATCISQGDYATACPATGTFVGCFQPTADAACCWRTQSGQRVALFGSVCDEGYACLADTDCPEGTGTCATTTCNGVTIGQCGKAPACK